ncbi:helix-turn-helix domain-containing protein [Thalassotalea ganghwensis]
MIEFFSLFAVAQMVFCILALLPHQKKNHSITLFILLMFCGAGYILGDVETVATQNQVLFWYAFIGGNALPGLFWLVSLSVFGDHVRLKQWQYYLASFTLIIPLSSKAVELIGGFSISDYPNVNYVIYYGALALELSLIAHALIIAVKHWRDDLVQQRRYIRGGVISVSALYLLIKIVLEQLLAISDSGLALLTSMLLAALVTGINLVLFQLNQSSLFQQVNLGSEPASKQKPVSREISVIVNSMQEELLYQQEGLTIAGFAKHLGIHEYKLRNLINGELGYRNFNDFLNYYRVNEVATKLKDSEFCTIPVLTLALESGFRSLSSFNKAFKAQHQMTPTEFRKKHLNTQ